jgi:hypothetical protein
METITNTNCQLPSHYIHHLLPWLQELQIEDRGLLKKDKTKEIK